jgi:hypothetical protein
MKLLNIEAGFFQQLAANYEQLTTVEQYIVLLVCIIIWMGMFAFAYLWFAPLFKEMAEQKKSRKNGPFSDRFPKK